MFLSERQSHLYRKNVYHVVFHAQEAGFSYVELNASDTRSKKSLKEVVSQSLSNTTMVDYVGKVWLTANNSSTVNVEIFPWG